MSKGKDHTVADLWVGCPRSGSPSSSAVSFLSPQSSAKTHPRILHTDARMPRGGPRGHFRVSQFLQGVRGSTSAGEVMKPSPPGGKQFILQFPIFPRFFLCLPRTILHDRLSSPPHPLFHSIPVGSPSASNRGSSARLIISCTVC